MIMKFMLPRRTVVATLALALFPSGARSEEPTNPAAAVLKSHIMISPEEIKWEDCSSALPPGAKCATIEGDRSAPNVLFTYRVKVPDNYKIAPHFHPADEHLTVISGKFNMGLGDKFDAKATSPMGAGSFMVMPKGGAPFRLESGRDDCPGACDRAVGTDVRPSRR
jgi:mannose-6-phosphate isomerase-like protein (cupin superfamily)